MIRTAYTRKTILLHLCRLLPSLLWANGDPVASFSAMTLSRTPVAVHVPEVQLMQESLEITPMGTYTHVHVTYPNVSVTWSEICPGLCGVFLTSFLNLKVEET